MIFRQVWIVPPRRNPRPKMLCSGPYQYRLNTLPGNSSRGLRSDSAASGL